MLFGVKAGRASIPLTFHFAVSGSVSTTVPVESALAPVAPPPRRTLRVCSDPNNMPFSNERAEGFENRLASMIASELDATLAYTWWPQRRGFVRETLKAGRCDVIMGVPATLDTVRTTRPYYRSGYAFVFGAGTPRVRALGDPALRTMRIGVPIVGGDGATTPPVAALARAHLEANMHGYPVYGDYREDMPAADVLRALGRGDIDVAIAWGPLAGNFAKNASPPLAVALIPEAEAAPGFPFAFEIAIGVRKADEALAAEIDGVLAKRREAIAALLDDYGVPRSEPARLKPPP
jgi:mxaJ protein